MHLSFSVAVIIVEWAIRLVMLGVIIARPRKPVVSLAWLAFIMLVPWLGALLYLLIGDRRLGYKRRRRYARELTLHHASRHPGVHRTFITKPQIDEHQRAVVDVADALVGMPILGGNQVELLPHATKFIDCLIADIEKAKRNVHMLYFIFEDDDVGQRVGEALARAAKRGVDCRVLADAAGSFFLFLGLAQRLREQGVKVVEDLPVTSVRRLFARLDLRNHRKLAVIDGLVAYTGSHNIIRPDYGHSRAGAWQDLTARIVGPSVSQLQAVFYEDWHFETEEALPLEGLFPDPPTPARVPVQVVPSGPTADNPLTAVMRDIVIEAMHTARRRVIITTPYFVPDEALLTAMRLAAARGVRVDLVMPDRSDNAMTDLAARAYFGALLEAGVRIHLNRAGLLHAKAMTVDDGFAMLGSANFDIRSFYLNFELNLLLYEEDATAQLRFCQSQYIAESDEVLKEVWDERPTLHKLAQNLAMLFSPLL
jgi:cardiolipin synthase A/B